jgi:hypothetical protein
MSAGPDPNWWCAVPRWLTSACRDFPLALMVFTVIAQAADVRNGTCSLGRSLIAREAGCSTDSVDRAVKHLVSIGALTVRRGDRRGTRSEQRNTYKVHVTSRTGAASQEATGGMGAPSASRMGAGSTSRTGAAQKEIQKKEIQKKETLPPSPEHMTQESELSKEVEEVICSIARNEVAQANRRGKVDSVEGLTRHKVCILRAWALEHWPEHMNAPVARWRQALEARDAHHLARPMTLQEEADQAWREFDLWRASRGLPPGRRYDFDGIREFGAWQAAGSPGPVTYPDAIDTTSSDHRALPNRQEAYQ